MINKGVSFINIIVRVIFLILVVSYLTYVQSNSIDRIIHGNSMFVVVLSNLMKSQYQQCSPTLSLFAAPCFCREEFIRFVPPDLSLVAVSCCNCSGVVSWGGTLSLTRGKRCGDISWKLFISVELSGGVFTGDGVLRGGVFTGDGVL